MKDELFYNNILFEDFYDDLEHEDIKSEEIEVEHKHEYMMQLYIPVRLGFSMISIFKDLPISLFIRKYLYHLEHMHSFYFNVEETKIKVKLKDKDFRYNKTYHTDDCFELNKLKLNKINEQIYKYISSDFTQKYENKWKSAGFCNDLTTEYLFILIDVPFKLNDKTNIKQFFEEFHNLILYVYNACHMFNILHDESVSPSDERFIFYKDNEIQKDILEDGDTFADIKYWSESYYKEYFRFFYPDKDTDSITIGSDESYINKPFPILSLLQKYTDGRIKNELSEQFDVSLIGVHHDFIDALEIYVRVHIKDPKKLTEVRKLDELIVKYIIEKMTLEHKLTTYSKLGGDKNEIYLYIILDELIIDDYPDYRRLYPDEFIVYNKRKKKTLNLSWYRYYFDSDLNQFKSKKTYESEKTQMQDKMKKAAVKLQRMRNKNLK